MRKLKKLPPSIMVTIVVSAFLLVTDIVLTTIFSISAMNRTTKIIQSKVMEDAYTAAKLLEGTDIGGMTLEDKTNQSETYVKCYTILDSFKTSSENTDAGLAYIYLMVKQGDKIVFSVDPCDDPAIFLVEEPIDGAYTTAMINAFNGVPGLDDKPYLDRWGSLYSGYVPVYYNGQVTAVVGVDVWADYITAQVGVTTAQIISISAVTIGLGVGLSLIITFFMRHKVKTLSHDFESLEQDVQSLVSAVEVPLSVSEKKEDIWVKEDDDDDPVINIHNKLNKLRGDINTYIAYAREQAYIDRLTRLGNRNAYFKMVKTVNEEITNHTLGDLIVGIYDANGLKYVNDNHGHEYGDRLLKISAKIVQKVFGSDSTFRIGGDEFVVVYRGSMDEFNAKHDEVNNMLDQFNKANVEWPFNLSLSLGIAKYDPKEDKELLDVFRKADADMYKNKQIYYKTHNRRSE